MGIDMEKVVRWYFGKLGVVLELKDQRAPQAFFSGEQIARFFIPEPISGGEETATCISYVRDIQPADALARLPLEFSVEVYGFGWEGEVFVLFHVGSKFGDEPVPEELRKVFFRAALCDA